MSWVGAKNKVNGAAEASVSIAKRLMKKWKTGEDNYLGLLNLQNTDRGTAKYSCPEIRGLRGKNPNLPTTYKTSSNEPRSSSS